MLRIGNKTRIMRRVLVGVGGTAVIGTGIYTQTESGRGFRRQARFWTNVLPVVGDYYWQLSSRSPYVKYLEYNVNDDTKKQLKQERMKQLHEKHAPHIFQTLLNLKGLYIKLGQVLSVTTLPIPEAYKILFRTLQSNVPGWESLEVIERVLEREWGRPVYEVLESIEDEPCGAASIGQAHRAKLKKDHIQHQSDANDETIIVKVQYPDAAWQVPADIQCVGDFMKLCVYTGVVDETAANLSFNEFSRQFLAELDYEREANNLREIQQSSVDPNSPYQKWGVVVPEVIDELCTNKIVTMTYLPGPKLEDEARRQLAALGIDTSKGIKDLVNRAKVTGNQDETAEANKLAEEDLSKFGWKASASQRIGKLVGLDGILWAIRTAKGVWIYSTKVVVRMIQLSSKVLPVPSGAKEWASSKQIFLDQTDRLRWTQDWITALFDVHGHQIFHLGLFNADPHPGNILVLDQPEDERNQAPKLGLIDFGQCKRLTKEEQYQIANLIVKVVDKESDQVVADAFRELGVGTKNDNTEFLASFAHLMFGPLQPYHLDHAWHKKLHSLDTVTYFPNQLSMAYRTSMLLRGLAVSLQINASVGDMWQEHARYAVANYKKPIRALMDERLSKQRAVISRRYTTQNIIDDLEPKAEHV